MKVILVIVTAALAWLPCQAQLKGFSIGPYAEVAVPVGKFDEINKIGYGVGLGVDIRLGKIGLTGSAGYMYFDGKTVNNGLGDIEMPAINAVPIRVGIKYRIFSVLYAKLESGGAALTDSDEVAFIIAPGIGVRVLGLDVQLKYEVWATGETYRFWGLKAGINF